MPFISENQIFSYNSYKLIAIKYFCLRENQLPVVARGFVATYS